LLVMRRVLVGLRASVRHQWSVSASESRRDYANCYT
jgi:hypothetical protein